MLSKQQQIALRKITFFHSQFIIGLDEVGLGALAGPLTVSAAVFRKGWGHPKVKDSKKLSPADRVKVLANHIEPDIVHRVVLHSSAEEIDAQGVRDALEKLSMTAITLAHSFYADSVIVIDGVQVPPFQKDIMDRVVALPKADVHVPAVCAASIIAKISRDNIMVELSKKYPGYGFEANKGYGTDLHLKALEDLGACDIHRISYAPVKKAVLPTT